MSRRAFHRPARALVPQLPSEPVVLPAPPELPQETAQGGWSLVLPLLSSVGMSAYMVTFGRPELIIIGVLFFLTSTGAVVGMRMQQKGMGGRAVRKQRARYRTHLNAARDQAREVAKGQRMVAAITHPEPARVWAIATDERRVWERRQDDADFLHVRLGTGEVPLSTPIQLDPRMDPLGDYDWLSLQAAKRLVEHQARISGQPVTIDVGSAGVISFLGSKERTHELARALLCQIGINHAPDDVMIAIEASGEGDWEWAKWLPHTHEPQARGRAGTLSLVAGEPLLLADFLTEELTRRAELQASRRLMAVAGNRPPNQQRLVLLLTGFAPVSDWGRSDLLHALLQAAGPQLGITLVFLVERETDEPSRVDLRVKCGAGDRFTVEGRAGLATAAAKDCMVDIVPPHVAELIARELSPLRLSDEHEQILARTVSLTEMVLGGDAATADITGNWASAGDPRLLRTPIGTNGDGDRVILDIKESAQGGSGPHGLIVGATGSGKSELLRTLVTGLSLTHAPDLLSFVLVDFKGGAAFAPLTDLPHVAGLMTNLADDAAMIDRVHAALMGEQQRRQRMLRDAGNIDSVREYQMRRTAGTPGPDGKQLEPLPYLLIIVDEFGELLSGRPEFVDLFVQIGRVGRSLGMHLLMATQRLEEGKLRGLDSHLSYRICLRTFSPTESRNVIGTPDAYKLPPIPGSAYLKVDESIYTRLRVAHVSARHVTAAERSAAAGRPDTRVIPFGMRLPEEDLAEELTDAPARAADGPTELQIVVDRLKALTSPGHQVWLPPLPPALALDHLIGAPTVQAGRGYSSRLWPVSGQLQLPLGIVDIPQRQLQETLMMDFGGAHGHLAVVGAPRTGRSTLLRTIMMAGMLTHTPEEMQFYCIDFGGGTLHGYGRAPHVGSVAGRTDPELLSRTLVEVRSLIGERERLFRSLGIDSIGDFRARRQSGRLPAGVRAADIFLLIDNWGAVRTEYENADQILAEIAARGLGAGVHLVITTGRWMDIRPALRDSIGSRFELRLNDPTESDINRRLAARVPANIPGRGLVQPGVYFQLVLPRVDTQDTDEDLREAQEQTLSKIASGWSGAVAPPVRLLPSRLTVAEMAKAGEPSESGVPIGIAEVDLRPVAIDLAGDEQHFVIFGDGGSGKSTTLRTWLTGLTSRYSGMQARVVLIDYRHALMDVVPPGHLGAYGGDSSAAQVYVQQVVDKLNERKPPAGITQKQLQAREWWTGPEIYVVVDDYDLIGSTNQSVLAPLVPYIAHAREVGLHMVLARRVAGVSRSGMDPVLTRIRDLGCAGLVLSGDHREGVVFGDERAATRPPGRGVLIRRGKPNRLVQIAVTDDRVPAEPATVAS